MPYPAIEWLTFKPACEINCSVYIGHYVNTSQLTISVFLDEIIEPLHQACFDESNQSDVTDIKMTQFLPSHAHALFSLTAVWIKHPDMEIHEYVGGKLRTLVKY